MPCVHPQHNTQSELCDCPCCTETEVCEEHMNYVSPVTCRCCGKPVPPIDSAPIHTRCITKHWGKHAHNVNASRCREFGRIK